MNVKVGGCPSASSSWAAVLCSLPALRMQARCRAVLWLRELSEFQFVLGCQCLPGPGSLLQRGLRVRSLVLAVDESCVLVVGGWGWNWPGPQIAAYSSSSSSSSPQCLSSSREWLALELHRRPLSAFPCAFSCFLLRRLQGRRSCRGALWQLSWGQVLQTSAPAGSRKRAVGLGLVQRDKGQSVARCPMHSVASKSRAFGYFEVILETSA